MVETRDANRHGGQPEDAAQMVPAPEVELWFVREVLPLEASLMRYLRGTYRKARESDDLLQDVYAGVIEAAQKELPKSPKPFVFAVAHNIMVNRIRRERIVLMDTVSDLEQLGLAAETPAPDRVVIARDELRHLRAAIERLPSRCREVILLSRVEGLSGQEIATRLNIDKSTVSHHIKQGMQLLADFLYGTHAPGEPL